MTFNITKSGAATWTRLAGNGRYDTMAAIVTEGFSKSDWAVIATGGNFPDALAASALAGAKGCPVILTAPNALSAQARSQLSRLGVKNVYIMGGTGAVSSSVESSLKAMGIKVIRLAGASRQDTSVKAMKALRASGDDFDTVVIATGSGFADTLSIGPWSYASHAPIVLTKKDGTLDDEAAAAIRADVGIFNVVIVGGTGVVSDKVKSQLGNSFSYTRLAGKGRYETSKAIADWELKHGMTAVRPAVATGANFPDALAGAALCGKNRSVMVLVKDGKLAAADALAAAKSQALHGYVLGGPGAVSDQLATTVAAKTSMTFVK